VLIATDILIRRSCSLSLEGYHLFQID